VQRSIEAVGDMARDDFNIRRIGPVSALSPAPKVNWTGGPLPEGEDLYQGVPVPHVAAARTRR
jgi:hypothetical protein